MFGLFLFLVIFVTLCLFIRALQTPSKPAQVNKTIDDSPEPVRTQAGAIPVRGFEPEALLGQVQNKEDIKPEETESATASENVQHPQPSSPVEDSDLTTEGDTPVIADVHPDSHPSSSSPVENSDLATEGDTPAIADVHPDSHPSSLADELT